MYAWCWCSRSPFKQILRKRFIWFPVLLSLVQDSVNFDSILVLFVQCHCLSKRSLPSGSPLWNNKHYFSVSNIVGNPGSWVRRTSTLIFTLATVEKCVFVLDCWNDGEAWTKKKMLARTVSSAMWNCRLKEALKFEDFCLLRCQSLRLFLHCLFVLISSLTTLCHSFLHPHWLSDLPSRAGY